MYVEDQGNIKWINCILIPVKERIDLKLELVHRFSTKGRCGTYKTL